MDSREIIGRFEQERQALAMMDHPNIARVFDAGATPVGRPYFVMELVKGIPITQFCDERRLDTRQRLALFDDVCSAIGHAHEKGIIHRDIKPSNVMVALHGDGAVPKVIDFGIAKALNAKLTDKTFFTRLEQAALSGLDIDTRADIYALGVLLYELLTGQPPFDGRTLAAAGYEEMRRIICEEEPPKPSARLATTAAEERTALARARAIDPQKLASEVEGDLDWIVMKAIEKDRTRRYATAKAFAEDLQRHLANEPVVACPPSASYLLQKLVRRQKRALAAAAAMMLALIAGIAVGSWEAAFAAACAVALTLIGGIGVSSWQAARASRAAARAVRAERAAEEERTNAINERDRACLAEQEASNQRQLAEHNLYAASMNLAQVVWDKANIGRLRRLLEETRTYPHRGFEWYYWQR